MVLIVKDELLKRLDAVEDIFEESLLHMKSLLKVCDSDMFKYFLNTTKVNNLKIAINQFLNVDGIGIILKVRELKLDAELLVDEYDIDAILLKIKNDETLTIDEKKALAVFIEKFDLVVN